MDNYVPPFCITDKIILLVGEISEQLGRISISILRNGKINPSLRR